MGSLVISVLLFAAVSAARAAPHQSVIQPSPCKCFPGDDCWPGASDWDGLNRTVGGGLIATTPLGSPCHDPHYDEGDCSGLRKEWRLPAAHMGSSSSVMAPLLGNYVRFAVKAHTPQHVATALAFAARHRIRLVVRNTGHDYNGRSTGAGALAVWTHHMKERSIIDWADEHYVGKALHVGAGVQGFEALDEARKAGLVVVTGECPSVGLAGGYTQGGGHSALSTIHGLAADNVLSYEVVLSSGEHVTASRTKHSDLYWALSGGGGGNYGVVVSMTVRAHPDARVSGASFTVATAQDPDSIYGAIDVFHEALPGMIDSGAMVIYFFSQGSLQIPAITVFNKSMEETEQILKPFVDAASAKGFVVWPSYTEFESYYEHYSHYFGPFPGGSIQVGTQLFGGRLIPRAVLPHFSPTARRLASMGVTFIGVGLNVSGFGHDGATAVLPQWRQTMVHAALTLPWSFERPFGDMVAEQDRMTREIQPVIEAATPGAGAYMNEADFQQPDWQETFFGANYDRLLRVKRKYDPDGLFYAVAGVGSEDWTARGDGRLCRV
ncbi:FAD binding domain-containingprotein [Purpureocillium lavendulum]|uniref:FAD binding domain-containingprotein n=1 Tax=Purpureocillium lavendulum TaxID=1247861 RepID=A0AB34FXK9_9HYPO|nr:FAD binding domain-containingprotein [Purpureocillium lavendulum]